MNIQRIPERQQPTPDESDDRLGQTTSIPDLLSSNLRQALSTVGLLANSVLSEMSVPTAETGVCADSELSEVERSFIDAFGSLVSAACGAKDYQQRPRDLGVSPIAAENHWSAESLDNLLSGILQKDGAVVSAFFKISGKCISSDPRLLIDSFVGENVRVDFDFFESDEDSELNDLEQALLPLLSADIPEKDLIAEAVTFEIPTVGYFALTKGVSIEGDVPIISLGYFSERPDIDDVLDRRELPELELCLVKANCNEDTQVQITEAADQIFARAITDEQR